MTLWIFIWLVLSAALLIFFVWTLRIHISQVQTWRKFAAKNQLKFTMPGLLVPPKMEGTFNGHKVSLFTGEHESPDQRGTRKRTAIEVFVKGKPNFIGGVASGDMIELLKTLNLPAYAWPAPGEADATVLYAAGEPEAIFSAYWTDQRRQAITNITKAKNNWVIYICRDDIALLRLDTPMPLDREDQLSKILTKMTEVAQSLSF